MICNFRALLIIILFFNFGVDLLGQSYDSAVKKMDTVIVHSGAISFKTKQLYDQQINDSKPNIGGFEALEIFNGILDKQVWVSAENHCVQLSKRSDLLEGKSKSIKLTWDKITGGCNWIGMGFGWDNWKPKDMNNITDSAMICIEFSSPTDIKNIPIAFALEDYSGTQAFVGFNMSMLKHPKIESNKLNTIQIPLSDFPYNRTETDLSNIKQFMIQFEADGELDVYAINIKRSK